MKVTILTMLAAGASALLCSADPVRGEFVGIYGQPQGFIHEGETMVAWRVYARFDNPLDQLNVVSGNSGNPVVIFTNSPDGFFQVDDPTSGNADTPHTQFAVDFLPALAYDTCVTIDNTGSFVSDGLTRLNLDGSGGVAGQWNFPTAFGPDSLVLTNAGWRKNPGNPDAFATNNRVWIGQFTVGNGDFVEGTVRLATVEDGVSMLRTGLKFGMSVNLVPCSGNTNFDLWIDIDDVVNVILDFGTDGAAHGGDVDGSGVTDIDDLVLVIENFGEPCFG